jgi:hypothetical protein
MIRVSADLRGAARYLADHVHPQIQRMVEADCDVWLLRDIAVSAMNAWSNDVEAAAGVVREELLAALDMFAAYLPSRSGVEALRFVNAVLFAHNRDKGSCARKLTAALASEV